MEIRHYWRPGNLNKTVGLGAEKLPGKIDLAKVLAERAPAYRSEMMVLIQTEQQRNRE
jgi:hypothetical protein